MDCDFSHDPDSIPDLLSAAQTHDLVIGSRYIDGIGIINWPFKRLLLSYGASIYTRIITGIPIYDTTGGFKCFTNKALKALDLNQIISNFEKETTVEIAIVTIDTFKVSKEKFEDLSLHIARTWGVGKKDKSNGVLIAISDGYRQIRIQNGDGITLLISDEETTNIIKNQVIPYFKKEEYFEGTQACLLEIIKLLKVRLK